MGILQNIAVGLASFSLLLPRLAAEEAAQPLLTALSSTTISGYADVGAHWNPGTGHAAPSPFLAYSFNPLTEILWQHADGRVATWTMVGTQLAAKKQIHRPPSPDSVPLQAVAIDDSTVIFQHSRYLWLNDSMLPVAPVHPLKDYVFAGSVQLVGSPESDLVWNNGGHLVIWEMQGRRVVRQHSVAAPFAFRSGAELVGIDHFNADHSPDLLWRDSRGFAWVTLMHGLRYAGVLQLNNGIPAEPGWTLAGCSHFNHDRKPDLLWQHHDGRTAVWFMNGADRIGTVLLRDGKPVNSGWKLIDVNNGGSAPGIFYYNLSIARPIIRVPQVTYPNHPELPIRSPRTNVTVLVPTIIRER